MRGSLRGANLRPAAPMGVEAMGEVPERPNGEDLGRACQALKGPVLARARVLFPPLSEPDLEDVFQSACLSVVRAERPVERLRAYLEQAVHSHAVTELRRRSRRATVPLPEFDSANPGAESASARRLQESMIDEREPAPEEQAEAELLKAYAADLLTELSARQRSVVKLRWGWSLSRAEIASAMGISQKAVKRELERGGRVLSEGA